MRNSRKISFVVGISTAAIVMAVFFLLKTMYFDRSDVVHMASKTPDHKIAAAGVMELIDLEGELPFAAESIVEIQGVIKEINYQNDRITILLEGNAEKSTHVICDIQQNQREAIRNLSPKDTIRLKGVYKGFLKDAIFLNCVLSE